MRDGEGPPVPLPVPIPIVEVSAELDLPGETGRQARIFVVWLVCLALAVVVGSIVGAHLSLDDEGSPHASRELERSRGAKAKVAVSLGLVLPALLTWMIHRRYRRGGAHARGIAVDVTSDCELRMWGRGYGTRIRLPGALVSERLVDVYAGRLGAWRQRRLRVRPATGTRDGRPQVVFHPSGAGGREIEIATTATATDMDEGLRVEGGEGDCVELGRDDFERLRAAVLDAIRS